jgi:hypothetical protein
MATSDRKIYPYLGIMDQLIPRRFGRPNSGLTRSVRTSAMERASTRLLVVVCSYSLQGTSVFSFRVAI